MVISPLLLIALKQAPLVPSVLILLSFPWILELASPLLSVFVISEPEVEAHIFHIQISTRQLPVHGPQVAHFRCKVTLPGSPWTTLRACPVKKVPVPFFHHRFTRPSIPWASTFIEPLQDHQVPSPRRCRARTRGPRAFEFVQQSQDFKVASKGGGVACKLAIRATMLNGPPKDVNVAGFGCRAAGPLPPWAEVGPAPVITPRDAPLPPRQHKCAHFIGTPHSCTTGVLVSAPREPPIRRSPHPKGMDSLAPSASEGLPSDHHQPHPCKPTRSMDSHFPSNQRNTSRCPPAAAAVQASAFHGQPCSLAQHSKPKCPPFAAALHVPASQGAPWPREEEVEE